MFRSKDNSINLTTDSGEHVKHGEVITIELQIPEKSEMKVGRLDKLLSDLQKDGFIKSVKSARR